MPLTRSVPSVQRIIDMTADELRSCALAKYFPRLSRAFASMHVDVLDGKLQQSPAHIQAALAQTLPRGCGEEFFYMATRLCSAPPLASSHLL